MSESPLDGGFFDHRFEDPSVYPERLVENYGAGLREAGDEVFDARAKFLRTRFDGYVDDTHHVRDVGYVCWPALADGRFEAYDDLCEGEREVLTPLVDAGFEFRDAGLSSVVLATPEGTGEYVVKLGRCGMGGGFGDGRRANLVEARLSADAGADAPVVPSLYCSGRGSFAVYPDVRAGATGDPTASTDRSGAAPDHDAADPGCDGAAPSHDATDPDRECAGSVGALREWFADNAPWLDGDEAAAPENRCVWRGRLRTLDYSHAGDWTGPLGVPDHVDGQQVVERVDDRRRTGEKLDLLDGGGLVEPDCP